MISSIIYDALHYQGPGGELAELRQYLCAQLLWDPGRDPMQVREEFCRGYYGKAASEALEFLRRMDQASQEPVHIFASWDPPAVVSPALARDALVILERAETADDDPAIRNRIGKLMLPFWYTMLFNPARYGLADREAPAIWNRARKVITDNKITFIRESGVPDGDAAGWVGEMNARFKPAAKDPVSSGPCDATGDEWCNALKPVGEPAGQVKVVEAGKPSVVIRYPAQPTDPEKKAATDLQHWIKEITGATLEIVSGDIAANGIVIHTDRSLGDEGYRIALEPNRLVLSGGKTRGVINAVYALLEEDIGCRFYTNDSIRLPGTDTLIIAPVARRYIPPLKIRDPYYACAFDPVWSLRNRTNAPDAKVPEEYGGRIDYAGMFVHTAAQIVPSDRYFKEHPEYFAQKEDGTRSTNQLCPTEPGVIKTAIQYVRQVLKEQPRTEIVSVSKNDNTEICHCKRCVKLREAEDSDMANQLFLVNQIADTIEKEYPDVVIDTLAYLETIQVPKTARPRKNVAIRLCNDAVGSWTHPFTPAEQCDVAKLASAWGAVHHRIYIWDYNVNFSHYLAPMPNMNVIAANIRFWIKNHAEGVMLQGGYQGPAEQDELKCWVASKLLWDPSWDEKALARDFIRGHYGKAAPALAEYETLLDQIRTEYAKEMASPSGGIRYPMDVPFLTKTYITRATEIFARARELARGDKSLARRVERAELPILYVQCVRGPEFVGNEYARVVGEFERIARQEKILYLQEGGADFEAKLATYKSHIPKAVIP